MAFQIIRQPDGELAVFNGYDGVWCAWGLTRDEVIEFFAEMAARDSRETTGRIIDQILAGEPGKAYGRQFAMTFAEANALSSHHDGDVLPGPVSQEKLASLREMEREIAADTA